jgi:hypothetical protein
LPPQRKGGDDVISRKYSELGVREPADHSRQMASAATPTRGSTRLGRLSGEPVRFPRQSALGEWCLIMG